MIVPEETEASTTLKGALLPDTPHQEVSSWVQAITKMERRNEWSAILVSNKTGRSREPSEMTFHSGASRVHISSFD